VSAIKTDMGTGGEGGQVIRVPPRGIVGKIRIKEKKIHRILAGKIKNYYYIIEVSCPCA
jgi:hypothetical protein